MKIRDIPEAILNADIADVFVAICRACFDICVYVGVFVLLCLTVFGIISLAYHLVERRRK